MKQLIIIIFISFLFINNSAAQVNCKVSSETLKGTYTGQCEKGKANGKGKAIGIDEYEGEFKNGFPDGQGMYVWKDGHYYMGEFKKGKMDGGGKMFYENSKGDDSTITGFWKNDKYIGIYEKNVEIISNTTRIMKLDSKVSNVGGEGSIIITTGALGGFSGIPAISEISVVSGQYLSKAASALTNSTMLRITQLKFPFRAIFYYSNGEYMEIQFNVAADYDVEVKLQ